MKIKNIIPTALILLGLSVSNVWAYTDFEYDKDNQKLTVITDEYFNHDAQISLMMYKPSDLAGKKFSELSKAEIKSVLQYFREIKADSYGRAEFVINLTADMRSEGGDYSVKLASSAGMDMPEMSQKLYSDAELSTGLSNLNSYIDNNTLIQRLEDADFRKILGLDEMYGKVSDKSIINISLKEYKNKYGISSFADIKLAENTMEQGINVFNDLNSINSWLNVNNAVKKYYAYKGTESTEYTAYKLLSDTSAIDKKIFEKRPYSSLEQFETVFKDTVNNPPQEKQTAYPTTDGGGGGNTGGGGGALIGISSGGTSIPIINLSTKTSVFSDVNDDFWAKDAIEKLVEEGIVSGMGDGTFAPNEKVTREQFLKMLLLSGEINCDAFDCSFADVKANEWYYNYVATAEIMGLASGYSNGTFGIGKSITREDICVLAYRLISEKMYVKDTNVEGNSFADYDNISDYAKQAVAFLKENGIISGYSDGTFMPKNTATRAEACRIILGITDFLAE